MMINRNNYETFFLLYIDNELSIPERKAVEEFVQNNSDLENEFAQFKAVVLGEDEIRFDDKINLYKSQAHDALLEEKLLMHLDGELDKGNTDALLALISSDNALKANWNILQQTKLDASEAIIFPDKKRLYRKERDNVIAGKFAKWAVAAALLGVVIFIGVSVLNKKTTIEGTGGSVAVIKNSSNVNGTKPLRMQVNSNNTNTINVLPAKEDVYTAQQKIQKDIEPVQQKIKQQKQQQVNDNTALNTTKDEKQILKSEQKINPEKPLMAVNTTQKPIKNEDPQNMSTTMAINTAKIKPVVANTLTDIDLSTLDNSMARTAGLTTINNESNNDHILYMKEETLNRSKAGIFFRKLKRVVERNTNIKTDKGLRIGGFELALK
jgi:hypothetical protein